MPPLIRRCYIELKEPEKYNTVDPLRDSARAAEELKLYKYVPVSFCYS